MKKIFIPIILISLILPVSVNAQDYYVDATGGSDSYDGLYQTYSSPNHGPWQTIDKVNNWNFNPGDTILFKRGEMWRGTLNVPSSGEEGNPITFGAYGSGDRPKIYGSEQVSSWIQESGNLWYAPYNPEPDMIYFIHTDESITWGDEKNSKGSLVDEYDWWWDGSNSRVYCYAATDPDSRYDSVEATARMYGIVVRETYINLENLEASFADGWGFHVIGEDPPSSHTYHVNLTNCVAHHNEVHGFKASQDSNTDTPTCYNITYINCQSYYNGYHGFQASDGTGDISYINCVSHHNGQNQGDDGAGFRFGETQTGLVRNCLSYNNNYGVRIAGWGIPPSGITVEDCDIHDNSGVGDSAGILILGPSDWVFDSIKIQRNKIYDNGGDGIFATNVKMTNGLCAYNLVYGNSEGGIFWQVYGSGGGYSEIYNNVIADNAGTGLSSGSSANVVKNNIIYNDEASGSGTFDYNLYFPSSVKGPNDISADPKFQNPGNNDYHLQPNSPCINAGTDVGLTLDFEGNPVPQPPGGEPDIGAYEYGSQPPGCGNENCDVGETCSSCPQDCKCPTDCTCTSPQICCSGQCVSPACSQNPDCGTDPCKIYTCSNPGTCSASCSSQDITSCMNDDGCCPSGCDEGNDNDCTGLGPVAWYHFDEDSGKTTIDNSGNGNDGTVYGATWTDGRLGNALEFDGSDDYVNIPAMLFSYPMTIELWVKPSDTNERHYIYLSEGTGNGWGSPDDETHISQGDTPGVFGFFSRTESTTHIDERSAGVQDTNWHHLAWVIDSTYRFYVDGTEAISGVTTGTPDFSSYGSFTYIGRPSANERFHNGKMDEVRIYNRVLTPEEISEHYKEGRGADLDNDGDVDIEDLVALAIDFGKTSGFDPDVDVVEDGEIDVFDVVFVASRFT